MIQLNNVSKIYGTGATAIHAVNDVSLSVSSGEIFGIIGYSGAGKSTLIRLFNGLETVTSGEVRVGSSIISDLSESQLQSARLKIGMIFQHFNLLWSRTVAQNIAFPLQIAGVPKSTITARVKELIGLVGLEGRENAYPSQLSGGQKQRVGIARALANEPELLLCDEATSALDPQTTDQILDLLLDINRKLNLTIVLITHEMQVARRICNRVAVMEAGKIVEQGDVVSLFTKPQKDVTKRFVRQISQEIDDVDPHSFDLVNGSGAIVHITYIGVDAAKPVLSEAIRDLGVNINILHGRVTNTASAIFGELYVHVPSDAAGTQKFLDYLQIRGVDAEIVKQGS